MSDKKSDKVPVTFLDVAAYFSAEEWKLLHEWQKELYKNVMKEIQQAFLSLGPLIATAVFSLRDSEEEERCPLNNRRHKRRINNNCSTRYPSPNAYNGSSMQEEAAVTVASHLREADEICIEPSSEDMVVVPDASLMIKEEEDANGTDHQGSEQNDDLSRRAVVSFSIKEEEDPFAHDHMETISRTTGYGSMNKERDVTFSAVCSENTNPFATISSKAKMKILQKLDQGTHSGSQLWLESNPELDGESTIHNKSSLSLEHSNSHQGITREESSDVYTGFEANLNNENLLICQPNSPRNSLPYVFYDSKNFPIKHHFAKHRRKHTFEDSKIERPYNCTECEKRFRQKGSLIEHLRTHTGQRPYQCADCDKSFSRKRSLIVHQTIHTGVRPYHCSGCERSFSLKHNLTSHRRICRP
ncbi:uncharacterized protein LOC144825008 isoform X1 [Lissotriton helveticus]